MVIKKIKYFANLVVLIIFVPVLYGMENVCIKLYSKPKSDSVGEAPLHVFHVPMSIVQYSKTLKHQLDDYQDDNEVKHEVAVTDIDPTTFERLVSVLFLAVPYKESFKISKKKLKGEKNNNADTIEHQLCLAREKLHSDLTNRICAKSYTPSDLIGMMHAADFLGCPFAVKSCGLLLRQSLDTAYELRNFSNVAALMNKINEHPAIAEVVGACIDFTPLQRICQKGYSFQPTLIESCIDYGEGKGDEEKEYESPISIQRCCNLPGNLLAVGYQNGTVELWDINANKRLETLSKEEEIILPITKGDTPKISDHDRLFDLQYIRRGLIATFLTKKHSLYYKLWENRYVIDPTLKWIKSDNESIIRNRKECLVKTISNNLKYNKEQVWCFSCDGEKKLSAINYPSYHSDNSPHTLLITESSTENVMYKPTEYRHNTKLTGTINALCSVSPYAIASSWSDGKIRIIEIESGTILHELSYGKNNCTTLCCLPDDILIAGDLDGTLKVWDIETKEQLQSIDTSVSELRKIFGLSDGTLLLQSDPEIPATILKLNLELPDLPLTDSLLLNYCSEAALQSRKILLTPEHYKIYKKCPKNIKKYMASFIQRKTFYTTLKRQYELLDHRKLIRPAIIIGGIGICGAAAFLNWKKLSRKFPWQLASVCLLAYLGHLSIMWFELKQSRVILG